MKKLLLVFFICLPGSNCLAQPSITDSVYTLDTVMIRAFESGRKLMQTPAAISIVTQKDIQRFAAVSLLPAFNTIAGVRMEQRSPGSYRLSIRGSLLRSPFGVRNIKLYVDDIPFTDAGGNTYVNLIEPAVLSSVEVVKGPSGSMYGAGTGGAVLMQTALGLNKAGTAPVNTVEAKLLGGSYGLLQQALQWKYKKDMYVMQLQQSHLQTDGYREHSQMRRDVIHYTGTTAIHKKDEVKIHLLYSDVFYQTPGALTLQQFQNNPKQARPSTAALPGAIAQKAAVYNKTIFAGLNNSIKFNTRWSNTTSLVYSHTGFKNPFITNYEKRNENSRGLRTVMQYVLQQNNTGIKLLAGAEWQTTFSAISNYGNKAGLPDTVQNQDDVNAYQRFYFLQADVSVRQKFFLQTGLSVNAFTYRYSRLMGQPVFNARHKNFDAVMMPRMAAMYKLKPGLTVRAIISKGFSVPTIAELRPSEGSFFTNLQPEQGWNYEAGTRVECLNGRLLADAAIYIFKLQQAIVRRNTAAGAEYFVNAGGTLQKGAEFSFVYHVFKNSPRLFTALTIGGAVTLNHFRFQQYEVAGSNFSGNKLTGVPPSMLVASVDAATSNGFYANITFNHTAAIPLNDANTVYANAYYLLQCKLGYRKNRFEVFVGADNLLNQQYSLGHDINAAGNRYYNAAALRNYFGGFIYTISLGKNLD
jgi:iron complex outermembrane recepter protein